MNIATIVEGHGEVAALPVLLRRINEWLTPQKHSQVLSPIRVSKDKFLNREEEFRRHLLLAAGKCGDDGWILILIDADDACPAKLGHKILNKAQQVIPHRRISVIIANREFEAWFIAAAQSIDGKRGFKLDANEEPVEAEAPRDAKGWISAHIENGSYRETTDQPAFAALIDLQQAHQRSRSFRKLCSEWNKQNVLAE